MEYYQFVINCFNSSPISNFMLLEFWIWYDVPDMLCMNKVVEDLNLSDLVGKPYGTHQHFLVTIITILVHSRSLHWFVYLLELWVANIYIYTLISKSCCYIYFLIHFDVDKLNNLCFWLTCTHIFTLCLTLL